MVEPVLAGFDERLHPPLPIARLRPPIGLEPSRIILADNDFGGLLGEFNRSQDQHLAIRDGPLENFQIELALVVMQLCVPEVDKNAQGCRLFHTDLRDQLLEVYHCLGQFDRLRGRSWIDAHRV